MTIKQKIIAGTMGGSLFAFFVLVVVVVVLIEYPHIIKFFTII